MKIVRAQKKIKLLWSSDINNSTGFGTVAYKVLPRLIATGRYDIFCLGINYHGERHGLPGIHVQPCDSSDPYGLQIFPRVVQAEQPDVIFVLQDLFVVQSYVESLKQMGLDIPMVVYFPIDGDSTPQGWLDALKYATIPVAYSNYGKRLIEARLPELKDNLRMIYHGIDTSVFKPLPEDQVKAVRKRMGIPEDKFLIGVVNRFQPRKLVPLAIRAFKLIKDGYKVCPDCGNYYATELDRCDLNFCTTQPTKVVPPKPDVHLYLHMNPVEHLMGGPTATLDMYIKTAGIDISNPGISIPGVDIYGPQSPTKEMMNESYNALDCYVATDCGEGFGITQVEALATGIPVIKSNNTTAPELMDQYGILVKSATFFSMSHDSGHYRPVIAVPELVDAIEGVYDRWVANGKKTILSKAQHEYVSKKFNWADKVEQFDKVLVEAIALKAKQREEAKHIIQLWEV